MFRVLFPIKCSEEEMIVTVETTFPLTTPEIFSRTLLV